MDDYFDTLVEVYWVIVYFIACDRPIYRDTYSLEGLFAIKNPLNVFHFSDISFPPQHDANSSIFLSAHLYLYPHKNCYILVSDQSHQTFS